MKLIELYREHNLRYLRLWKSVLLQLRNRHIHYQNLFSYSNAKSTRISGHISVTRCSVRPVLLTIRQGYPTREAEKEMMNRFQMNDPLETLHSIISSEEIITMQKRAREVLVGNDVQDYLLEIIEATRNHELIEIGVSPRGTLAFMRAIQARAILNERDYCTPDDIKTLVAIRLCSSFNVND